MCKETKPFWIVSSTLYFTAAVVSASLAFPPTYTSTTQTTSTTASSLAVRNIASSTSTSTTVPTTTSSSTTTDSTTTYSTTTYSTTTGSATIPLSQTNVIVTRASHVIGVVTAEIYRRVKPDCSVDACSDTALSVDVARSLIHCAAMCSQSPECLYYRTLEYKESPDPRDKICYLYGLPPTVTENSYKFMGQV